MTEDQQKEAISREFLRLLAYNHGFKVIEPPQDHGVDMMVCPITKRVEPSGKIRFLDSQFMLHFQLKSTTLTGIVDAGDDIKFDLEVKNYNDLVFRREEPLPLHLVVVVLDSNPPACVSVDEEALSLAGKAYWYLPVEGAEPTKNTSQIRITIPKANQLGIGFMRERFEDLGFEL
ncbi:MAG: DUF4365 domain-containing protein [Betaproteobacteria bacterium]|nr:DUF4365 domain-containing protein [Betaproteobacteria bacterium]MCX7196324.1 DUF4365 domain-containing protein [Pseudomonadota bacterium]